MESGNNNGPSTKICCAKPILLCDFENTKEVYSTGYARGENKNK